MLYKTKCGKLFKSIEGHQITVRKDGNPTIITPYKGTINYLSWEQLDWHLIEGLLEGRYEKVCNSN